VKADRVVDATGAVVAPGFIDAHAHAPPAGDVEAALAMGVTTLVVGQDGLSPADRIGPWLTRMDASRPRVNIATLVGHSTVRNISGARGRASLKPGELERMRALVDEAMREGAFGLSTGLEYDPGRVAGMPELIAVAEPVGARGGVVMSHLRSEDDDRIEASLDELFEQCKKSGARAHISHFKIVLGRGEKRAAEILARLAEARRAGLEVTADLYPYAASYTTLAILFPDFARRTRSYAETKQRRRADLLAHLRARVEKRNGPEATLFGTGEYTGKTLADVARARGVPFEEILLELGPNGGEAAYFVMDDAVVAALLMDPFAMIGTDGGGGGRHPRGYGTFARVIEEFVEKRRALSLEEAVRKMAGLPARTLGLEGDRGCVRAGCAADLVVFVPSAIKARADWGAPYRVAEGMKIVMVGGVIEREGGVPTAGRGGRALRFVGPKEAAAHQKD
jgi:N-acyl-D-amino-acid deacylase